MLASCNPCGSFFPSPWGSIIALGHSSRLPKSSRVPVQPLIMFMHHLPPTSGHLHAKAVCLDACLQIPDNNVDQVRAEAGCPLCANEPILIVPMPNPGCHICEGELTNNHLLVSQGCHSEVALSTASNTKPIQA